MNIGKLTWTLCAALVACVVGPDLRGQTPPALSEFEVASVKPAPPPTGGGIMTSFSGGPGTHNPGTIVCTNTSLSELIRLAYGLKPYQVSGPRWLDSTRFDITAKVPSGATRDQVPAMWRTLLAERFQLTAHKESKELPLYELVISKSGLKLKESPKDDAGGGSGSQGSKGPGAGNGGGTGSGSPQIGVGATREGEPRRASAPGHKMSGSGITVSRLADMLAVQLDRPVMDKTGLTGTYDFTLSYSDDGMRTPVASSGGALSEALAPPSLVTAVEEQLGLKLEPRKGQVEILVIDGIEKVPTVN